MLGQRIEQVKLLGCHVNRARADAYFTRGRVNMQIAHTDWVVRRSGIGSLRSPQHSFDMGQQHIHIKGLCNIVIGSQFETDNFV